MVSLLESRGYISCLPGPVCASCGKLKKIASSFLLVVCMIHTLPLESTLPHLPKLIFCNYFTKGSQVYKFNTATSFLIVPFLSILRVAPKKLFQSQVFPLTVELLLLQGWLRWVHNCRHDHDHHNWNHDHSPRSSCS